MSFCYLSLHMSFFNALLLFCVLCTLPFRVILIHIHRIFILNMAWPFLNKTNHSNWKDVIRSLFYEAGFGLIQVTSGLTISFSVLGRQFTSYIAMVTCGANLTCYVQQHEITTYWPVRCPENSWKIACLQLAEGTWSFSIATLWFSSKCRFFLKFLLFLTFPVLSSLVYFNYFYYIMLYYIILYL